MTSPDNTIGYGAVVLPHLNEFQGFFIVDDPILQRPAVQMQMMALTVVPGSVIGSLQAAIVEGVITHDMTLVGTAALALHGITKQKFFWIKAYREAGGTRTEMFSLNAVTIEEAQAEVNNLPPVLEMKDRLRNDVRKPKH